MKLELALKVTFRDDIIPHYKYNELAYQKITPCEKIALK